MMRAVRVVATMLMAVFGLWLFVISIWVIGGAVERRFGSGMFMILIAVVGVSALGVSYSWIFCDRGRRWPWERP